MMPFPAHTCMCLLLCRLKKEMVQRVNVVASEFRKVSHSQMAETTKRAIRENVAISVQLTKLSDRSYDLLQENEQLKEAQVEMQKQLEMLEHNEKEMAKNSLSHQKVRAPLLRCLGVVSTGGHWPRQLKPVLGTAPSGHMGAFQGTIRVLGPGETML